MQEKNEHGQILRGFSVDCYEARGKTVALVLWKGADTTPYMCLKPTENGKLGHWSLLSNDDVPAHETRNTYLLANVELHRDGPDICGIEIFDGKTQKSVISLMSDFKMLTFKQHIQTSKIFHEGKEQGLTLAHETALNQRGIISHVGDNLGCVEYNIVQGFSWADVDSVVAEVDKPTDRHRG